MNVLLLEDDKILSETIAEVLEEHGFTCKVVLTGDAALEATYAASFDLYPGLCNRKKPMIDYV